MFDLRKTSIVSVVALGLLAAIGCHANATTTAPDPEQGLTVTGSGEAIGVPDEAMVTLGVQQRGADPATATNATSATTEAIIAALVGAGVERSDIQSRQISVHEDRRIEPRPMPPTADTGGKTPKPPAAPEVERVEYVATNMLEVRVTNLDDIGQVLGAASKAGVNQMHGIELRIGDPESLEQKALDDAMAKAKAKAQHLAASSGVQLGDIVAIRAGSDGGGGIPMPVSMAARDLEMEESNIPVERGEITVRQSVWIKYEIR
jgi:uncharacterized protein YggE